MVDVNILKKADDRMVGCAFVEFKKVTEATNALKDLNSSQMLGRCVVKLFHNFFTQTYSRTIAVDWAVPKEVFNDKKKEEEGLKEEETVVKEEIKEENDVTAEEEEEEEEDEDSERVSEWIKEEDEDQVDEEDSDEDEDDEEDAEEEEEKEEEHDLKVKKPAHNLKAGHDIGEGKTVFIRNLSYDSEEHELKALMEEFFGRLGFNHPGFRFLYHQIL